MNEYVADLYVESGYMEGDDTDVSFSIYLSRVDNNLIVKATDAMGYSLVAINNIVVLLSDGREITIEAGTSQTIVPFSEESRIVSIFGENILELDLDTLEVIIDGKTLKLSELPLIGKKKLTITVSGGSFSENIKIELSSGEKIYIVSGNYRGEVISNNLSDNTTVNKISIDGEADVVPDIGNTIFNTSDTSKPLTIYFITDVNVPMESLGLSTDDLIVDRANQSEVFTMMPSLNNLVSFKDIKNELPLTKREIVIENNIKKEVFNKVKDITDINIDLFDMERVEKNSRHIDKIITSFGVDIVEKAVVKSSLKSTSEKLNKASKIVNIYKTKHSDENLKGIDKDDNLIFKYRGKLDRALNLVDKLNKQIEELNNQF